MPTCDIVIFDNFFREATIPTTLRRHLCLMGMEHDVIVTFRATNMCDHHVRNSSKILLKPEQV